MFKFFTERRWYGWSIFGSIFILVSTWYQVQLDVKINEWFAEISAINNGLDLLLNDIFLSI